MVAVGVVVVLVGAVVVTVGPLVVVVGALLAVHRLDTQLLLAHSTLLVHALPVAVRATHRFVARTEFAGH